MNGENRYIEVYRDSNRKGLLPGIISAVMGTAAVILPFTGDIRNWIIAMVLALIGGISGFTGLIQSGNNAGNKIPKRVCIISTVVNVLVFVAITAVAGIMLAMLMLTGGR